MKRVYTAHGHHRPKKLQPSPDAEERKQKQERADSQGYSPLEHLGQPYALGQCPTTLSESKHAGRCASVRWPMGVCNE